MPEIVERVDALEEALMKLAYAQFNTEMELQKLSKEVSAFKDEMSDFKDEMSAFKEENRRTNREMNKRWGQIANKLGTLVEDLVAPSLSQIIKDVLGQDIIDLSIRRKRRLADGQVREFDAIAITANTICLNSTKSTLRSIDVEHFGEEIEAFRAFFPEYAAYPIVGILASLTIEPSVLNYAERQGLLVLGVGGHLMEVKNAPEFVPKRW